MMHGQRNIKKVPGVWFYCGRQYKFRS